MIFFACYSTYIFEKNYFFILKTSLFEEENHAKLFAKILFAIFYKKMLW